MQAIILLGGYGTRLRSVLPDLPKPMAPIKDKPFLAYLLDYLKTKGVTKVIFSVHYLREKIRDYFQTQYAGIEIDYAEEEHPLGTGGAIIHALSRLKDHGPVFVLNGDTFIKLDYQAMHQQHLQERAAITMALRSVPDSGRYGKVVTQDGVVTGFIEKGESGPGLINAGVYLINPSLFTHFSLTTQFSFESDFIRPYLGLLKPHMYVTDGYFVDIGIPEDYARAQSELIEMQ